MKIPSYQKIIKSAEGFKVSAYRATVDGKKVWIDKSETYQETIPNDKNLLQKLEISVKDYILFIAGYYGDWANAIAESGCHTDYSEISPEIVNFAKNKFGKNKNIKKFIISDFAKIPEKNEYYDWTVSFEPVSTKSGLILAVIRSLMNNKGIKIIMFPRESLSANKYDHLKLISEVYNCLFDSKEVFINSINHSGNLVKGNHKIITIQINKKAKELALKDIRAMEKNNFSQDSLERLSKIGTLMQENFLTDVS
jgi:hypothetical protein